MSEKVLLWAIRKEGQDGDWYGGPSLEVVNYLDPVLPGYHDPLAHCGILIWDSETFPEGELLAYELGEEYEIVPYLTLEQVLEAFIKAKNQALRGSTPAARMMVDGLFKALGLG